MINSHTDRRTDKQINRQVNAVLKGSWTMDQGEQVLSFGQEDFGL